MDSRIIYLCSDYDEYRQDFKSKRIWRTDGKYEPFVYIIQEVETEMMYIGSRTKYSGKPCLELDLGTIYFTSSVRFDWESNPSSFEICRIISCASNHDALILESELIEEHDAVKSDMYYNQHHPDVGWNTSGMPRFFDEEHRKKLSLSKKGVPKSEEHKRKILEGITKFHEDNPDIWKGENSHMFGRNHSKETRIKISKANSGREMSKEFKEFLSNRNKELYKNKENHPFYGKSHSKDSKMKISESNKGRQQPLRTCPHCGKEGRTGSMSRFHFDNCKMNPERRIEYIKCPKCKKNLDKRNLPNTKRHHFDNCIFV